MPARPVPQRERGAGRVVEGRPPVAMVDADLDVEVGEAGHVGLELPIVASPVEHDGPAAHALAILLGRGRRVVLRVGEHDRGPGGAVARPVRVADADVVVAAAEHDRGVRGAGLPHRVDVVGGRAAPVGIRHADDLAERVPRDPVLGVLGTEVAAGSIVGQRVARGHVRGAPLGDRGQRAPLAQLDQAPALAVAIERVEHPVGHRGRRRRRADGSRPDAEDARREHRGRDHEPQMAPQGATRGRNADDASLDDAGLHGVTETRGRVSGLTSLPGAAAW